MEGFKQNQKMKCDLPCFKEGGFVKRDKAKHSESTEMKKDVAKDKKIVKKAFKIHDEQSHDEKTDLSKLKKGGRAKKEVGTVKKYKAGGSVKKMADGGMSGMGNVSDAERAALASAMAAKDGKKRAMAAAAKKGYGNYKNTTDPSLAFSDPMKANAALSESVLKSGGSQSDIDEANEMARADMMRGLQAVGKYAYGGKVC